MNQNKLTKFLVFLMLFIYIANTVLGEMFYLHYTTWWFDMVMHFFGGFWAGLFFIWFFRVKDASRASIFKIIAFVFVAGIFWELFQLYADTYLNNVPPDWEDIITDVCFNLAGAASSISFFKKRIMKVEKNDVQS